MQFIEKFKPTRFSKDRLFTKSYIHRRYKPSILIHFQVLPLKILPDYLFAILSAFFLVPGLLTAQAPDFNIEASTSFYGGSGGTLPFWLHTNREGKIDSSSTNWINEIGLKTKLYEYSDFSMTLGGNLVGRVSKNSTAFFSELYLNVNFAGYRLSVGRFPDPIGLNNHDLSVGSMMVSRNATPIPKISISTPEFLDLPFTNGVLQYRGMFSHGWLEEDRFVSDALLHQKYLYLKINIGDFSAVGGAVHNVMWGGRHPEFGQLPQTLGDFIRVAIGKSASETSNASLPDIENVIGNSIAAYEFGVKIDKTRFKILLTRLFYLEDKVSTRFRSPWDGVWGINWFYKKKNSLLNRLIYEHINTKQQDAKDEDAIGRSNYYNNNTYESGWTYYNRILGISLFNLRLKSNIDKISTNIIIGHHFGINGAINKQLDYKLLLTYSRNYGINPDRLMKEEINFNNRRIDKYSFLIDLQYEFPTIEKISVLFSVAGDKRGFYKNNIGLIVGFIWN